MCSLYHTSLLLLGSNQGDKETYLKQATASISNSCGDIVTLSPIYFSKSWGYNDEDYINQAIELKTTLTPEALLLKTQQIEKTLGRNHKTKKHYEARPIDIDILFYDEDIIDSPHLVIPHPRLHLRNFVLQPLKDIAPHHIHPILKETVENLAQNCVDKGKVWR